MSISPEARAVQALSNELDVLVKDAEGINKDIQKIHAQYVKDLTAKSNQYKKILEKIGALQNAIKKVTVPKPTYSAKLKKALDGTK